MPISILVITIALITIAQLIILGSVVFLENRDPTKTIIWLLILGALPILGALIYLMLGRLVRKHQLSHHTQLLQGPTEELLMERQAIQAEDDDDQTTSIPINRKLANILMNDASAPITFNNRSQVLTNGIDTFKAIFDAIESAKNHIHLEFFIFHNDSIGRDILNLLMRKVSEGVKVRVLVDGLVNRSLRKHFGELRAAGVEAEVFYPVRFPFLSRRLNLRNHRKIVVIDGRIGFLGGLNVGDEYLSLNQRIGFWRDTFLKLEGDSVNFLQAVFLNDWNGTTRQKLFDVDYYPKANQLDVQMTQIAATGPDSDWGSMLEIFFVALTSAEKAIYIETPYFIPDEGSIMALKTAALSGIDVRVILQGVADHKITYWASLSYVEELLEAGVRIYQYKKGVLHAKILILDGEIGVVGSTNFDIRSFSLNFEISAFIYDEPLAHRLERDFYQDLQDSKELILTEYKNRPFSNRLKESSARLFSPLL
ncbi:major cardiolipin synthase ClsA [Desulfosporosinus acididurans]|uniref:Cardiolipin synthase n=1 Tax=Desulfosporosinus acididurans TaxID=476652 RepID=A0A0J1FNW6_9FIRM|nr:cardiolipin synthase [Desulfosporosinus acididurans]KLU65189.1 major cardiolipin synthase ClsA [Desulfosporosinus acididurans]